MSNQCMSSLRVRCTVGLAFVVSLASVPAQGQVVFDINTLDDDISFSSTGDGDCAVREALANLSSGSDVTDGDCPEPVGPVDTLRFSVTGTIVLDGGPLQSDQNVIFDGPGADQLEISGNDASSVINVTNGLTILRRISIAHGNSSTGAITTGDDLFIDRCLIRDNVSTLHGGALYLDGSSSDVTVSNSTFAMNEAAGAGGAIYIGGGNSIHITNTTFSGNYAAKGGGAINVSASTLEAENLTVFNNAADSLAGGIHTRTELDLKHSIILGNLALDGISDPDCTFGGVSTYTNRGYNLVGDGTGCTPTGTDLTSMYPSNELDTQLEVNGADTPTHALVALSQAIDSGETVNGGTGAGACVRTNGGTLSIDQRFLPRARGVGMGGSGCDIGAFEAQDEFDYVEFGAEVLLQGPYAGGFNMGVTPLFHASRPVYQPYRASLFDGSSLEYDGFEQFGFDDDEIDWVLVSLRSSTEAASEVARTVAILQGDGTVAGPDGGYVRFSGVSPGSFYVVIDHWNHLPVMSAEPIDFSTGLGGAGFKNAMESAYSKGGDPMKDLGSGAFGMFACDINFDGFITVGDFNIWNAATTVGATGYLPSDCDMDGNVTAPDFNLWNPNTTEGAASQVPD